MKYWSEYLKDAGMEEFLAQNPRPEREYLGKGEYCQEKEIIFDIWRSEYNKIESEAYRTYETDMREENRDLSDEIYSLAYSEAYERGHSAGYDEVCYYVRYFCDLFRRVISLNVIKKEI